MTSVRNLFALGFSQEEKNSSYRLLCVSRGVCIISVRDRIRSQSPPALFIPPRNAGRNGRSVEIS